METYHGHVRTTVDSLKLFEACRLGLLPRVQRRLSEKERQSIRSGSVFVWDEREAGMRRWTDGKSWSASRVSGSFLTYREMEGKRGGGFGTSRRGKAKSPESGRGSDEDQEDGEHEGYRYKADGLMKQSFSITTTAGQHLHLISYYARHQPGQPDLPQPSSDPALQNVVPPKGLYPESSTGEASQTPATTRTPMPQPYVIAPPPPHHHHHHHHPSPAHPAYAHYTQLPYGWHPASPAQTPSYAHFVHAPYAHHAHAGHPPHALPPPPPHPAYAAAAQGHYAHASPPPPPPGERPSLPHPHPHPLPMPQPAAALPPPYQPSRSPPTRRPDAGEESLPRRPSAGLLTALGSLDLPGSNPGIMTPPTREHSTSPPEPKQEGAAGSILPALLHPSSESSAKSRMAANRVSDPSSPRTSAGASEKSAVSEDARALRMLDRKFCL